MSVYWDEDKKELVIKKESPVVQVAVQEIRNGKITKPYNEKQNERNNKQNKTTSPRQAKHNSP